MADTNPRGLLGHYERALWGLMDAVGVTASVQRKMLVATLLQFGAIVTIFVLGVGLAGVETLQATFSTAELAVFGAVFVLAVGALLNTILILNRDFVAPIEDLEAAAQGIASGELDKGVPETDQRDEIGDLVRAFGRMHGSLEVLEAQAEAISKEAFDDPALDEELPGSFGAALSEMEGTLQERIEALEEKRRTMERQNTGLRETAAAYSRTMEAVADGDLTQRLETSVDQSAMADVARSFNEMVAAWESIVTDLEAFAGEVAEGSAAVERDAAAVRSSSEDVGEDVTEISAGVEEQSEQIDAAAGESETVSATIQEITASADNVATLADRAADVGDDGREAAQAAESEMDALRERSESATAAVRTLNETLAEVGDVTDVILDIADQTNILALNAGIEAARADAGGEGFAVVAEEVKSLAQETKASAEEIEALIESVQDQSETAVTEIEEMADRVDTGTETVETATAAFETLAENVEEISTSIDEVNQATAEQAQSMQDVVGMLDDIAAVSDQTATKAESVADAAESQTTTLSAVAENTSELAGAAAELETRLEDFEAAADETGQRPADTEFQFGAADGGPDASVDLGADTSAARSDLATDGGDE